VDDLAASREQCVILGGMGHRPGRPVDAVLAADLVWDGVRQNLPRCRFWVIGKPAARRQRVAGLARRVATTPAPTALGRCTGSSCIREAWTRTSQVMARPGRSRPKTDTKDQTPSPDAVSEPGVRVDLWRRIGDSNP
jgi:hypothetical protein